MLDGVWKEQLWNGVQRGIAIAEATLLAIELADDRSETLIDESFRQQLIAKGDAYCIASISRPHALVDTCAAARAAGYVPIVWVVRTKPASVGTIEALRFKTLLSRA